MTQIEKARVTSAGIKSREITTTGGLSTSCSTPVIEAQYLPCADECCYRLGRALRMGWLERDGWGFNFTRSILRHNKRRNWEPSEKQLYAMRRLLDELSEPVNGSLIDADDCHEAA